MGKPFDLSRYPNLSIKSFELEELVGIDSMDALARVAPPGANTNQSALGTLHLNQLVAQSISKVDGELVMRPFVDWTKWTLRTQEFVVMAYTRHNGITKEERDSFLEENFGTPGGVTSSPSSQSGPGLPGT